MQECKKANCSLDFDNVNIFMRLAKHYQLSLENDAMMRVSYSVLF